jgi:hypothetical protein
MITLENQASTQALIRFLINAANAKEKYFVEHEWIETFKNRGYTKYEIYSKTGDKSESIMKILVFTKLTSLERIEAIIHAKKCAIRIRDKFEQTDVLRHLSKLGNVDNTVENMTDEVVSYLDNL